MSMYIFQIMEIQENINVPTSIFQSRHVKLLIKITAILMIILSMIAIQFLFSILPSEFNNESVLLKSLVSNLGPSLMHVTDTNYTK